MKTIKNKIGFVAITTFLCLVSLGSPGSYAAQTSESSSVAPALDHLKQGRMQEAIAYLEDLLKKDPADVKARQVLANVYFSSNEIKKAEKAYLEVLKMEPNAEAYNNLGVVYLKEENAEKAVESLQKAVELDPNFTRAYFNLGELSLISGKFPMALAFFKKAETIDKNHPLVHYKLGVSLAKTGRLEEALKEFEEAVKRDPDNLRIKSDFGMTYMAARKFDRAQGEFQKVVAKAPRSTIAHFGMGLAQKAMGQREKAVESFQKTYLLSPEFIDPYLEAGDLLRKLGRAPEAVQAYQRTIPLYEKTLKQDPKNSLAHLKFAKVLIHTRHFKEAKKHLKEARSLEKDKGPLAAQAAVLTERIKNEA
ncbi:MAG: tetratricopeptide repeat protein [Candidatus Omnitrophica bacterium]|nr:tetratricopeptide repeat protein [Candidatus Omnitrophota bacterium]